MVTQLGVCDPREVNDHFPVRNSGLITVRASPVTHLSQDLAQSSLSPHEGNCHSAPSHSSVCYSGGRGSAG